MFHEPNGIYHGRGEIDRVEGKIKATHPDFRYQVIAEPEELGDVSAGPMGIGQPWRSGGLAGTVFIIARDGRISAVYLFSTSCPETEAGVVRS